jgi:hypothetical protein
MPKQTKKRTAPPHRLTPTFEALADTASAIERTILDALMLRVLIERTPDDRAAFVRRIQELDD